MPLGGSRWSLRLRSVQSFKPATRMTGRQPGAGPHGTGTSLNGRRRDQHHFLPWGMILQSRSSWPSNPCGIASIEGFDARVHYLQHRLLKFLSHEFYTRLADVFALNDFVFAGVIDPELDEAQSRALDTIVDHLWRFNARTGSTMIAASPALRRSVIISSRSGMRSFRPISMNVWMTCWRPIHGLWHSVASTIRPSVARSQGSSDSANRT